MFGNKFTVEEKIRLQEELREMVEKYGMENVLPFFEQYIKAYQTTQKFVNAAPTPQPQVQQAVQSEQNPAPAEPQVKLPPNPKSIEEFEKSFNAIVATDQVNPQIAQDVSAFITGAKAIFYNDLSDKNFIMGLTTNIFTDRVIANPFEDWIAYNTEKMRIYLKRHLRIKGYQFLDSEVEVGTYFDSKKHNAVQKEFVRDSSMDGRVLKVLSEGLIIARTLHINCNVVIGKYVGN